MPGAGEQDAEVGCGHKQVAGGEETRLVHPLTGRHVDGVRLLLDVLELRHVVIILVVQTEHVPGVFVELGAALGEVDMFRLWRWIIAGVVDVAQKTILEVGRFHLQRGFDTVKLVVGRWVSTLTKNMFTKF